MNSRNYQGKTSPRLANQAVRRARLETEEAMVLILKCDAQSSQVLHGQNKVLELHEQLLACRHGAATDGEFDLAVPSNVGNCD
jgi:hypothetical protein